MKKEKDKIAWLDPEVARTVRENRGYLDEFYEDLQKSGLKDSTIGRHISNADLFLEWLGTLEGRSMAEGLDEVDNFLGNWYIRRCMWSTPGSIKTTAASLKKFYKCMMNRGHISESGYREFLKTVKEKLPAWQQRARQLSYLDQYEEDDGIEFSFWESDDGLMTDAEIWGHPLEGEDMAETWSPGAEEPDVVERWSPFSNL